MPLTRFYNSGHCFFRVSSLSVAPPSFSVICYLFVGASHHSYKQAALKLWPFVACWLEPPPAQPSKPHTPPPTLPQRAPSQNTATHANTCGIKKLSPSFPERSSPVCGATAAAFPGFPFAQVRWLKFQQPTRRENVLSPLSLAQPVLILLTTTTPWPGSGVARLWPALPGAGRSRRSILPRGRPSQASRLRSRGATPP